MVTDEIETDDEGFPGSEADEQGTLTLWVVIAGKRICLATVTCDSDTGLYETFIGLPFSANQLGLHDSSQERAVARPRTSFSRASAGSCSCLVTIS
jgi:hypothetical protein